MSTSGRRALASLFLLHRNFPPYDPPEVGVEQPEDCSVIGKVTKLKFILQLNAGRVTLRSFGEKTSIFNDPGLQMPEQCPVTGQPWC